MSFKITIDNVEYFYDKKIRLLDLTKGDKSILCARVNNKTRDLYYEIDHDAKVEFVNIKDRSGTSVYETSIRYLFCMAAYLCYPNIKFKLTYDISRSILASIINKNKILFDDTQKKAIIGALNNNLYIITGGPGTGKTTIIKTIVQILENKNKINKDDIVLLAPTGRSAKKMQDSVGYKAYTIHKFLKWNKELETFQIDEYNKAKEKVVIVDEASMIDIFLFSSLLKGLRLNVKLILVGDVNQLPSIAPGDVLRDLLCQNNIKNTYLNKIYRVNEESYISDIALDIKNQKEFNNIDDYNDFKFIKSSDEDIKSYLIQICNYVKSKKISLDNFQVLVPMYKGVNGIDNLNILMADIFNSKNKKYQIGDKFCRIDDKVIQLVNDVDNNVYNGDIGYIKDINIINKKTIVEIEFGNNKVIYTNGDFDKFSLAYAISIHKSQGSEYDHVVIILANSFVRMFYNKLIYTAVTRAKSSLTIIGSLQAFNTCIKTLYANNRKTYINHV